MTAPNLKRYDEFKQILSNYQTSDYAKSLLEQIKLVLLVSPTSAGRNTIIRELVKTDRYEYVVSDTTRPKRTNNGVEEQDGNEYYFKTEEEFLDGLKQGNYLEAEIIHEQQVSGTSIDQLKHAKDHDKIAVHEIEVAGAASVIKAKPDTVAIFVLPPSYDEWMSRLNNRSKMHQDEMLNRLKSSEQELIAALENDYYKFVINDDLTVAVDKIREIVEKDVYIAEDHQAGQDLAWKLLNQVKQILYS